MDREELTAWLRLQMTPGVGNGTARKLLTSFGLPGTLFNQSLASLCDVASEAQAKSLLAIPDGLDDLVTETLAWLQADPDGRRVLPLGDPAYPQALLETEDPPLLLYGMGMPQAWEANALNDSGQVCMAVVGSRNPTPQGLDNAHDFSKALAEGGLTVVSGLALGVDGAAHEGALDGAPPGQLATIAVVGTGLDRVYPKQHRDLAHRIAQRGLLLSEYALGTPPLSGNFPKHNRIISGLARGTLVVEAALKSGSLITARMAIEQGRDVFAIPGSIHATQSRGCHALIKQGAKLVESAQDILEELHLDFGSAAGHAGSEADAPQGPLVDALGFEPCTLDALQARTGLDTPALQVQLMALELEGHVARLPGGLFQRLVKA